ncbi:MAG TPA: hypothetical protein VNW52_10875, partial [Burkholderiaceae bacterium]|nr:hypothetical protein [Burkholderiaceae bacterium]
KSMIYLSLPILFVTLALPLTAASAEEAAPSEVPSATTDAAPTVSPTGARPLKGGYAWVFRQTGQHDHTPFTIYAQFNVLSKNKEGEFAIERVRGEPGRVVTWDNQYAHKTWFAIGQPSCLLDIVGQGSIFDKQPCPAQPAIGDTWTAEDSYPEPHTVYQFKVVGMEEVQVPAGRFQTIKIMSAPAVDIDASRDAKNAAAGAITDQKPDNPALKKRITTYWYAPELSIIVKAVREFSGDPDIPVGATTDELEAVGMYDAGLRKRMQRMQGG